MRTSGILSALLGALLVLPQASAAGPRVKVQGDAPALMALLDERNIAATATAGAALPTAGELAGVEVAVLTAGTPWSEAEAAALDGFVKKGGGLILLHAAVAADPLTGRSPGEVQAWAGVLPLFFTPAGREQAITRGISNFDLDDEALHGLVPEAGAEVLATTWSPNRKHLKGTVPQPYVYGVSPLIWTSQRGQGRVVHCVPGAKAETFHHPAFRAVLLRAIGWAAGEKDPDNLCLPADLAALTYPPGGPLKPEDSLAALKVHPDFTAELVAAEPLISKPIQIDWDGGGRLWVAESVEYPEGREGGGPESMTALWQRDTPLPKPAPVRRAGRDTISWLEDADGDGRMDRKRVFAEGLDLVTSFCFHGDGVIVAQPPEILLLRDTDGDGRADRREVLYAGLGTSDRHAVLNNLRWGMDGWVYATHGYAGSPRVTSGDGRKDFGAIGSGVVRFRPDGSAIEMVSAKAGNCWGLDLTADGEIFFTQPTSGDLLMHVPVSDRLMAAGGAGRLPSWQVTIHLRPVKPLMSWEEIVENQPNDVIGSFTAACGCAIYEGGSWPAPWTYGYFTAEPTVHILHHEAVSAAGVTYSAAKTRDEEFSATRDFWSRPIDNRIGPDGQLYAIDFYNQAILHNDPRGPIHLWNNQAARPDRDHFFGRIVRYRHREAQELPAADLTTPTGQLAALGHPNREVRLRAQRLLEEGDVKAAAGALVDTTGLARVHALWLRAAAGMLTPAELERALDDPAAAVRVTVGRVLGEHPALATPPVVAALAERLMREGEARVRLQWLAGLPATAKMPPASLVTLAAGADDPWTRAAVARLAKGQAAAVLAEIARSPEAAKLGSLAAVLFAAEKDAPEELAAMLTALQGFDEKSEAAALSGLEALGAGKNFSREAKVAAAFEALVARGRPALAAAALPLASRGWPAEERAQRIAAAVTPLLASPDPRVTLALSRLPAFPAALAEHLEKRVLNDGGSRPQLLEALAANDSSDAARLMVALLPSLSAAEKAAPLESLLGRPAGAMILLDRLQDGSVTPAVLGATALARLADHPDAAVKQRAAPLIAGLRGAHEAKEAIIARLLPEVSPPGDAQAGHALFAACAVCHRFREEGALIGPVLEGIGVHGVETLLTHIVDPNREVEPSYAVWNVATDDGRTLTGFPSRETAGSLFLKNAGGEVEVPRERIVSRTNTGKSLMPEGFEALGAPALRDLIAYLRSGEQRFHTIPFGKAATADGSRGVYLAPSAGGDRVSLKRYGLVEERGVPFQLQDPLSAPGGRNVIVLKGGMDPQALSHGYPQQVEIPVKARAARLHLLGAVAGWGYPAYAAKDVVVTITVHRQDGSTEDLVFRNGIDFADHVGRIDVPGSAWTDLTERGQMRYLWRDLKTPAFIEKLTIAGANGAPAPLIAALTLEEPGKEGLAPPPAEGGPATPAAEEAALPVKPVAGTLRVLMAGGGSSHDFAAWYQREDQELLREAGGFVTAYAADPATAAAQLANAEVFLFSANDPVYARSAPFRQALADYVARGGGLVLLHPAVWYNWPDWPAYNSTLAGGGSRAHDPLGEFGLTVLKPDHPVTAGLPREFRLRDELYQVEPDPAAKVETLVETSVSAQTGRRHPSVWIVAHPQARIVAIATGHDGAAHRDPNFRRLLTNAVRWAGAAAR